MRTSTALPMSPLRRSGEAALARNCFSAWAGNHFRGWRSKSGLSLGGSGGGAGGLTRAEENGRRATAARAGDGGPRGVHLGEAEEEVEGTDGVPGLEPHDALQVRFGLRRVEAPVFGGVHLRALLGEGVNQ